MTDVRPTVPLTGVLVALLAASCSAPPEPGLREAVRPTAAAPAVETADPVTRGESPEVGVPPEAPPAAELAGDGRDAAGDEPAVRAAEPELPELPEDLALLDLQQIYAAIRADIRGDRMGRAWRRYAAAADRLDFAEDDPRRDVAEDLELLGGFLRSMGADADADADAKPQR